MNGRVIGHIVDGKHVPKAVRAKPEEGALAYGAAAFARSVSGDLLSDLLRVFDLKEAYTIMAIATLRVIDPGIPCQNLRGMYESTFVSVFYPHLTLGTNSVGTFLTDWGANWKGRGRSTVCAWSGCHPTVMSSLIECASRTLARKTTCLP